ncbi:MAG: lipoyl-dependent peroxiredoxin [Acidimicrobiaceae bacterium]|jgi:osmotically inducible protein OsmC|nr:lipoyl-dependent peroxiredoxin [Acidimicrobiaceae bacterium]
MAVRSAHARWEGPLVGGKGTMDTESGAFSGQYSFSSRFEEGGGTNPEELIGAAHAGCFSMAFAHGLAEGGHVATSVDTTARVTIKPVDGGFAITGIELTCEAVVPGISDAEFQAAAEATKVGCPVSKALSAVPITLDARLIA